MLASRTSRPEPETSGQYIPRRKLRPFERAAELIGDSGDPASVDGSIGRICCLSAQENKLLVRRLIDEAVAKHDVEVLDELAAGEFALVAKRWVGPFQSASGF